MEKRYKSLVSLIFMIAMGFSAHSQSNDYMQDFEAKQNDSVVYLSQIAIDNEPLFTIKQDVSLSVYPNPAVTETTIAYNLTDRSSVYLRVVDLSGKQLAVLLPKQMQNAGKYEVVLTFSKYQILPGMYIIHMIVDDKTYSKKVIVQ